MKRAILAFVGAEAYGRLNDRAKPQISAEDLTNPGISKTLKFIFEPEENKHSKQSNFRGIRQQNGESFSEYGNRSRREAVHANFSDSQLEERLIQEFIERLSFRLVVQNLPMKAEGDENFVPLEYVSNLAATIMMVQKATASSPGSPEPTEDIVIHKLHKGPQETYSEVLNEGRSKQSFKFATKLSERLR